MNALAASFGAGANFRVSVISELIDFVCSAMFLRFLSLAVQPSAPRPGRDDGKRVWYSPRRGPASQPPACEKADLPFASARWPRTGADRVAHAGRTVWKRMQRRRHPRLSCPAAPPQANSRPRDGPVQAPTATGTVRGRSGPPCPRGRGRRGYSLAARAGM